MLARHQGQIVLVWGAIPGERVRVRVERTGKGVTSAETIEVLTASPDRRSTVGDWRCGGNAFAHVDYPRQLRLKGEIIQDAFGRIGRMPLPAPDVIGSPERGYRMRARLHASDGRFGFYREGTHQLCEPGQAGQLLPETVEWLQHVQQWLYDEGSPAVAAIELAENAAGSERACHLECQPGVDLSVFRGLAGGLTGVSAQLVNSTGATRVAGTPAVADDLHVRDDAETPVLHLRRDVRAFFQGNRFLLERLVQHVVALVPPGQVVDLYAGVGLFGLAVAAGGAAAVTLVEGDPISGADLAHNAEPFEGRVHIERSSVEAFLARAGHARRKGAGPDATFVVDPPRTGLSKEATASIIQTSPARIVYVSCDVATLARDARLLLDAGYEMNGLTGIDLFPNTAHVESIALFAR